LFFNSKYKWGKDVEYPQVIQVNNVLTVQSDHVLFEVFISHKLKLLLYFSHPILLGAHQLIKSDR